jgi:mono/diheme cytochrome c family protein
MNSVRVSCPRPHRSILLLIGFASLVVCVGANHTWLSHVPDSYRAKANPYAGQPGAIAPGRRLFSEHCAQCHQPDAMGKGKRPSLRSGFVQQATDGELFWVLRNGLLAHGMPSWSMLPPQQRWQIIAYVKSLGPGVRPTRAARGSATPTNLSRTGRESR